MSVRSLVCVCAALVLTAHARSSAISKDIVDAINSNASSTWVAGYNSKFESWSLDDAKKLMGTKLGGPRPKMTVTHEISASAPASFDSRAQWPNCIGPIMNQGDCGSCWAFGAAEAISDRMCIEGKVSTYLQLAPLDLVTCDNGWFSGCNGCQGGQLTGAWNYAKSSGLVTERCLPYLRSQGGPIPTCAPQDQPCEPDTFVSTPSCNSTCVDGTPTSQDKHYISQVYQINGADQMAAELVQNGPFEAAFTVYEDFLAYKSGVYTHTTGKELGGHAIKIIGYGTESGQDYWLVQNSWTTTWGDGGYFKIARGVDECGIEDQPVAGKW